jgi:uncharacterized protein
MERSVAAIATTPVKGFALSSPEHVSLGVDGLEANRRFALLDERGERLRSSKHAWPCTVAAEYDVETEHLSIRFPAAARSWERWRLPRPWRSTTTVT